MHSPILPDYSPIDDLTEFWSDWEFYSDDYYDEEPVKKAETTKSVEGRSSSFGMKRKTLSKITGRRKRRRKGSTTDISEVISGDNVADPAGKTTSATSIVVWRSKETMKTEPVIHPSGGERVSLLKNWRETFGPHPQDDEVELRAAMKAQRHFSDQASTASRTVEPTQLVSSQLLRADVDATDDRLSDNSEWLESRVCTINATGPERQPSEDGIKAVREL